MTEGPRPVEGDSPDPPTLPIPVATVPGRRRRPRRGLVGALIALVVLVVLGAIAFTVGDGVFRANAESQIERSVSQSLPSGVTGQVRATIGGGPALIQYLRGSFDHVTLTSQHLEVAGAPASATLHLRGLPVNGGKVDRATARLAVDQAAFDKVPQLRNVGASAPKFGAGTVSTTLSRTFLGIALKVAVVMKPSLTGQTVHLEPSSATITAGPASIPATAIVQQLLPNGVSVCAASYLPRGVEVTSVQLRPGEAVVGLSATDIDLNSLGTGATGSCG
ncbi:LmeA family phospholipid-binding protein [Amnibacterium sp.]|uniref:LmeA family phospholipid-binding protein n=1 Tax=Amnibacterium sp. TaxID=1872496 RepID=UPI003F7B5DA9